MQSFYNKLGVIGGGRMGEAIIRSLLAAGMKPDLLLASDADPSRQAFLREEYRIRVARDNSELAGEVEVLILAVKPGVMESVLKEIGPAVKRRKPLLISVAAGIRLGLLAKHLGGPGRARLVRVMPNTPALIGEGVSAFYAGPGLLKGDRGMVKAILSAFGRVVELDREELMDAVTGLSGSGPAYVFLMIEALADGGVKMGLTRNTALALAAQTVLGAGKMVIETGKHPAELKDMVTSPGGTTIEGLGVLERGGFRGLLIQAVEAGCQRSRELAGEAKTGKGRGGKKR
jgi:pyrroline-5-carboxylate reductase